MKYWNNVSNYILTLRIDLEYTSPNSLLNLFSMRSCHQQDDYIKVIQYIKTLVQLDKTRHIFLSNKPIYVEIGWFWNLGPLVSLLTELPLTKFHQDICPEVDED